MIRRFRAPVALAACLFLSTSAFATNGYFTHGVGAKNKGMAGAGLASPEGQLFEWQDDSTYIKNPPYFDGMTLDVGAVSDISE